MRAEMERIWLETGKTVVFVTHDIDEALQLADRTVVLSNKPTRVLEIVELEDAAAARHRAIAILMHTAQKLVKLFRSIEQPARNRRSSHDETPHRSQAYGRPGADDRAPGPAIAKEKVTYAYLLDPGLRRGDLGDVATARSPPT